MPKLIQYYSTNLKSEKVPFKDALLKGLAPDKGLYMPEMIPQLSEEKIQSFSGKEYYEIAYDVMREFLFEQISDEELLSLVKDAYNFSVPLENVYDRKYIMRLDQGPTASFKDFAGRMMGRWMQYYLQKQNQKLLILTATSGDTGSAVANAFYGLKQIQVVVLYPEKEVTERQRKQMTTLGENIQIISVDGKFDDCQALVKRAFTDSELFELNLSSANSINIGRLIPQSVYYFYAYAKLRDKNKNEQIVFSVPSGNFGDMMGGVIATQMGLPVKKFIISTNQNDEFPNYLSTGIYNKIEPSINCLSSAMNVGHPSNLARLVALYNGQMNEEGIISKQADLDKMRKDIFSVSVSDNETKEIIKKVYDRHKVILEPHGAVGWAGLTHYLAENNSDIQKDQLCVSLETAHPAKFPEEIRSLLNIDPVLPDSLKGLENKTEYCLNMKNDYSEFKQFLKNNF